MWFFPKRYFIDLVKRYYFTNSLLYLSHLTTGLVVFPWALFMHGFNQKSFSLFSKYLIPTVSLSDILNSFMKNPPTEMCTLLIFMSHFSCISHLAILRLFLIIIYSSRIRPKRIAMFVISLMPNTLSRELTWPYTWLPQPMHTAVWRRYWQALLI